MRKMEMYDETHRTRKRIYYNIRNRLTCKIDWIPYQAGAANTFSFLKLASIIHSFCAQAKVKIPQIM